MGLLVQIPPSLAWCTLPLSSSGTQLDHPQPVGPSHNAHSRQDGHPISVMRLSALEEVTGSTSWVTEWESELWACRLTRWIDCALGMEVGCGVQLLEQGYPRGGSEHAGQEWGVGRTVRVSPELGDLVTLTAVISLGLLPGEPFGWGAQGGKDRGAQTWEGPLQAQALFTYTLAPSPAPSYQPCWASHGS